MSEIKGGIRLWMLAISFLVGGSTLLVWAASIAVYDVDYDRDVSFIEVVNLSLRWDPWLRTSLYPWSWLVFSILTFGCGLLAFRYAITIGRMLACSVLCIALPIVVLGPHVVLFPVAAPWFVVSIFRYGIEGEEWAELSLGVFPVSLWLINWFSMLAVAMFAMCGEAEKKL